MSAKPKLLTAYYGDAKFEYYVVRKENLSTKRKLDIHVHPIGTVQVDAPENAADSEIKTGVQKRARWILTQLNEISERKKEILPREYISGECVLYLGRRYQLKIDKRLKGKQVKLYRGKIIIPGRNKSQGDIKLLLDSWYRDKARITFEARLIQIVNKLPWVKAMPKWKMIKMKKQWGSCSAKGVITLNPHLVKAPVACIDYVILHELCHLKEHNHSKRFYRLLDKHMPEWLSVKTKLDGMSESILNI